jgi:hypothetical protein
LRDYTLTRAELLDRAAEVFQAVGSGALKLRIERTYSLGEVAQAHRDLESRKTTGKLLLLPSAYWPRIDLTESQTEPGEMQARRCSKSLPF